MKHDLRMAMIQMRNLLLFIVAVLKQGTPFYLWPQAWRDIQAEHLALVRKQIWELKKAGRIREDRAGRMWLSKPKE